jgi:RNA polymerase sigma-70 factor (ECF subfamily)
MEEATLILEAQDGSTEAFSRLVLLHQSRVRAFVSRFVREDDVADDLAQEVFIIAFRSLKDWRADGAFAAWLFVIARNRTLEYLRAERRRRSRETSAFRAALSQWSEERLAGISGREESEEQRMVALSECLQSLPPHNASIVREVYFERRSPSDVARVQGRTQGVMRVTLLRIRQSLRRCMEGRLALSER